MSDAIPSGTSSGDPSASLQNLTITAEENYAHARDHEHLRAQITAILVAASFVLVGLAIDKEPGSSAVTFMIIAVAVLSLTNVSLVFMHNNRFERHVDIARQAKDEILKLDGSTAPAELTFSFEPERKKWGALAITWVFVAALPILACIGLWIAHCAEQGADDQLPAQSRQPKQ